MATRKTPGKVQPNDKTRPKTKSPVDAFGYGRQGEGLHKMHESRHANKTGCSIVVVRTLGVGITRIRFPAPRPQNKNPSNNLGVFVLTAGGDTRYVDNEITAVPKTRMQGTHRLTQVEPECR